MTHNEIIDALEAIVSEECARAADTLRNRIAERVRREVPSATVLKLDRPGNCFDGSGPWHGKNDKALGTKHWYALPVAVFGVPLK